jgi:hypothetical protein
MDRNRASKRENIDSLKIKNPLCNTDSEHVTGMHCPLFKTKQQYCPVYKTEPGLTGSQTFNATPHIRTLLYTHSRLTAYGFILGKTAGRMGTGALQQEKLWPPSKGLCVPGRAPDAGEKGACVRN